MGNKQTAIKGEKEKRFLGWDVLTAIALKCARNNKDMIYPLYRTCKRFHDNQELKRIYNFMKMETLFNKLNSDKCDKVKITFIRKEESSNRKKKDKVVCRLYYVTDFGGEGDGPKRINTFHPFFSVTMSPDINDRYIAICFGNMLRKRDRIKVKYGRKVVYVEIED